jgi:hypothetical protein
MICKNEDDRTLIELPYTEENLEYYTEELFRKAGIKANVSIVADKSDLISGGDAVMENVNWKIYEKSITVPYRYFYYIAKLVSTGKPPENIVSEKPYRFMDFLKEVPIQGNFFGKKEKEETPPPFFSPVGMETQKEEEPMFRRIIKSIKEEIPVPKPEEPKPKSEEPLFKKIVNSLKDEEPESEPEPEASMFQKIANSFKPEETVSNEEESMKEEEPEQTTPIQTAVPEFLKNNLFKEDEKKKIVIEIFKDKMEEEEDLCKIKEVNKYKWLSKEKILNLKLIEGNVKYKNTKVEKKEIRSKRLLGIV